MRWTFASAWRALRIGGARLAMAAVMLAGGGAGASAFDPDPALERQPGWSRALFQAERLGSRVTAEIRMAARPAASEAALFMPSPRGTARKAAGREVVKLSARIRIEFIGREPLELENHVWLDPCDGAPLYLIRTRRGLDDYHQRFRFTHEGAFRRQHEPGSAAEAARPPEAWSRRGEHFYAYPQGESCSPVLETTTMLYRLAAAPAEILGSQGPWCIFHKRQLHRVSLRPAAAAAAFDYLEKRGESAVRRSGTAAVRRIGIISRPIGSYRGQVEDFLGGGARLDLSCDQGLPLTAGLELPLLGGVELQLKEIELR